MGKHLVILRLPRSSLPPAPGGQHGLSTARSAGLAPRSRRPQPRPGGSDPAPVPAPVPALTAAAPPAHRGRPFPAARTSPAPQGSFSRCAWPQRRCRSRFCAGAGVAAPARPWQRGQRWARPAPPAAPPGGRRSARQRSRKSRGCHDTGGRRRLKSSLKEMFYT